MLQTCNLLRFCNLWFCRRKLRKIAKTSRNHTKNLPDFGKKTLKDLKKTQCYGGKVPQVASKKSGKKQPWITMSISILNSKGDRDSRVSYLDLEIAVD